MAPVIKTERGEARGMFLVLQLDMSTGSLKKPSEDLWFLLFGMQGMWKLSTCIPLAWAEFVVGECCTSLGIVRPFAGTAMVCSAM